MVAKNNEKVNMKRRQQNQKFPSFQMFRFAAGGVGGAANKNDRKFLVFAPARACRARPRRKCHSSKSCGFCPKYIRTLYNTHRQNSEFKFPPKIWSARSAVCSAFPPQNPDSARIRHAPRDSSFANTKL